MARGTPSSPCRTPRARPRTEEDPPSPPPEASASRPLNLLFLMFVAFLPFPTRLVGEALHQGTGAERVAAVVYGLSLLGIRLLYFALAAYSRARHLRQTGTENADMRESGRKFRFVVAGYIATIVLALFVPTIAIAVYLAIAIFLFIPFRAVMAELSGHN